MFYMLQLIYSYFRPEQLTDLSILPNNCVGKIFSGMDLQSLSISGLVSKKWNQILEADYARETIWNPIIFKAFVRNEDHLGKDILESIQKEPTLPLDTLDKIRQFHQTYPKHLLGITHMLVLLPLNYNTEEYKSLFFVRINKAIF